MVLFIRNKRAPDFGGPNLFFSKRKKVSTNKRTKIVPFSQSKKGMVKYFGRVSIFLKSTVKLELKFVFSKHDVNNSSIFFDKVKSKIILPLASHQRKST